MKHTEHPSQENEDHLLTEVNEKALFRMQLALQSVEEQIAAGESRPEVLDARDMLRSQVELLERIESEQDEFERESLKEEFRSLVASTEEIRRRWRALDTVH